MQVRIAICDDEEAALSAIREKVIKISKELKVNVEIFLYRSGKKLMDIILSGEEQIDILLLDIDMPEMSGLEVAKILRYNTEKMLLIFISSHEQYVFESIEFNPFRYIRKYRITQELPLALEAACSRLEKEMDRLIVVKSNDSEIKLHHSEIMYYEIESRKLKIHLYGGKSICVRKTIKDFTKELDDNSFIMLHSGCVVNAKYIQEFSNYDITLDNAEHLIVSRTRIKAVKKELLEYWGGKI